MITLASAKQLVTDGRYEAGGIICPCCDQRVKVYRRKITSPMAAGLIELYSRHNTNMVKIEDAAGDDGRLLLKNGYHRAYAMRDIGITHAPCIVQTVASRDELGIAVNSDVARDLDFYFASARPPILKDFFDPKIRRIHQVYKTLKMIEIEFEVREHDVGA